MVFRMLKLEFYVPRALENTSDVKEIEESLKKVKSSLNVDVRKYIIDENGEEDSKSKILWGLSVGKRIKIKQTRKSKSIYLQLIVFGNNNPIMFYPQTRTGEEIKVKEFLGGLLKREINVCTKSLRLKMN